MSPGLRTSARQALIRVNASYWFIPGLMTVAALLLSLLTVYLDQRWGSEWLFRAGITQVSTPEGARQLLAAISGSMISVAGTVFAITIAAVVYASGNYGPRLLNNFMTDRGNQVSLGVFIATFVYGVMILRTIHSAEESDATGRTGTSFVPELSLLVALVLSLLSVAVLVYFLHHVPDSIRINSVVAGIGRRLIGDLEKRFPEADDGADPPARAQPGGAPVFASTAGYVEVIDYDTIESVCEKHALTVFVAVRTGDFVHSGVAVARVEGDLDDGAAARIESAFAVGGSRTPTQDLEFSIDELVEIALRALSPGINDPFTAITCLHWIGAATALLAGRRLDRAPDGRAYGEGRVHALPDDFDHYVGRGFGEVRASAAANSLASRVFVDVLFAVSQGCSREERRQRLTAEAEALLAQAEFALAGPALNDLAARVRRFERSSSQ